MRAELLVELGDALSALGNAAGAEAAFDEAATMAAVYGDNRLRALAESGAALRVKETAHVDRIYIPEADVLLDLFEPNDHHTICPFKGEADYWTLTASDPAAEDIFWTYRTPFPEVAGLAGHLGVYHEKDEVRVEIETPDGATHSFPE